MRWKKHHANIIIVWVLSLVFTIVTLLNIIGPLHTNAMGTINPLSMLTLYSIIYYFVSLLVIWILYHALKNKPELLFFVLLILGMVIMITEVFMWGWMGS